MKGKLAIAALIALLITGTLGNLWASYGLWSHFEGQYKVQQQQNQQQGRDVVAKLCTTFGQLAALKPPAGDAATNPSRAYDQHVHDILAGVLPDIGCVKAR